MPLLRDRNAAKYRWASLLCHIITSGIVALGIVASDIVASGIVASGIIALGIIALGIVAVGLLCFLFLFSEFADFCIAASELYAAGAFRWGDTQAVNDIDAVALTPGGDTRTRCPDCAGPPGGM